MDLLVEILNYKRTEELPRLRRERPIAELRARAALAPRPLDFRAALAPTPSRWPRVIAEIQRASPARGVVVRGPYDPAALAAIYAEHGAAALSVQTDARYFQGGPAQLEAVCAARRLPVLRRDFILDEYQVVEARAAGADAVALIAEALGQADLRRLIEAIGRLRMAALVEVRDEAEVRRALDAGAALLGLNNRDLHTFATDLAVAERLRPSVPPSVCTVALDGVHTRADIARMQAAGVDAVLAGEPFLRARPEQRAARVQELTRA